MLQSQPSVRYVFARWSGDASGTQIPVVVRVDRPKTIIAIWKAQFYLSVATSPTGLATIEGSGWYDQGVTVEVNAPAVAGYSFATWSVDGKPVEGI